MGRCWTCGEGACSRDGLTADADLTDAPQSKCGSWLACDGSLTADQDVGSDRVHIRSCGNGHLWFRSYSGSLLERPKSNQKAFAPPLGTSPAFGQRGLTGRFRSKARSRAARLASWLPSIASELCRYLWLSQASQLPPLLLCCVSAAMPLDSPGLPAFRQPMPSGDSPPHTWPSPPASHGWPSRYAA